MPRIPRVSVVIPAWNASGFITQTIRSVLTSRDIVCEVIVVDAGRIVQRGPHSRLVEETGSIYAKLYASWLEQTR